MIDEIHADECVLRDDLTELRGPHEGVVVAGEDRDGDHKVAGNAPKVLKSKE